MISAFLFWSILGLALSLALGMAFSAMESASLALNRMRLLQIFGDEHPEARSEQEVLRDTKDLYFVSRLGLCATLVVAGFSLQGILSALLAHLSGGGPESATAKELIPTLLTLVILPPLYFLAVIGLPRLSIPASSTNGNGDEIPRWRSSSPPVAPSR